MSTKNILKGCQCVPTHYYLLEIGIKVEYTSICEEYYSYNAQSSMDISSFKRKSKKSAAKKKDFF